MARLLLLLLLPLAARPQSPAPGGCGAPVCVPKCCAAGEALRLDRRCHPSAAELQLEFVGGPAAYGLLYGNPCRQGKYPLMPDVPEDQWQLLGNGSLRSPAVSWGRPLATDEFCLEVLEVDEPGPATAHTLPFVCFPESSAEQTASMHAVVYPLGLLVSVPFLAATAALYTGIRSLRDLHGRAVSCCAAGLAAAYLALAGAQLAGPALPPPACSALAYAVVFSFIACFCWLNVMCGDACWLVLAATGALSERWRYPELQEWRWWPDRGWIRDLECPWRDPRLERRLARRVFVGYSAYAWGLPALLLVGALLQGLGPALPAAYLRPGAGGEQPCWASDEDAAVQYFYWPIGFILLANAALLAVAMYHVWKHHWNEKGPHRMPKQRARMCLVLFLSMCVSWGLEVVSWAAGGPPIVWAVADAFNVLQGVVVFCIFVLEPRVKALVWRQLCAASPRPRDPLCVPNGPA